MIENISCISANENIYGIKQGLGLSGEIIPNKIIFMSKIVTSNYSRMGDYVDFN